MAMECVKGCGFFGSVETQNMCSKCYKDFIKTQPIAAKPKISAVDHHEKLSQADLYGTDELMEQMKSLNLSVKVKANKNRCESCKKKVRLLGFECRCGGVFCGQHRMPELHMCDVNHKRRDSSNVNPHLTLVKADKLEYRI